MSRIASFAVILPCVLFVASSSHAVDLDAMLIERPLAEGLGIEGVLTIWDETPRMYTSLGEPTKKGATKYVYEGRRVTLIVESTFTADKRYAVSSIGVRGRDERVRSGAGVHLGDSEERVIAILGQPGARPPGQLSYPQMGVDFTLAKGKGDSAPVVVGIDVHRAAIDAAEPPAPAPAAAPAPAPDTAPPRLDFTLAHLSMPLTERWVAQKPLTLTGGVVLTASGTARVEVSLCFDCSPAVEKLVQDKESALGPNRLSAEKRSLDAAARTAMGVDDGYAALYGPVAGVTPTWLLALRKAERTWLITISVLAPAEPEVLADLVQILRQVRTAVPEVAP
jgi:hypothetical protein